MPIDRETIRWLSAIRKQLLDLDAKRVHMGSNFKAYHQAKKQFLEAICDSGFDLYEFNGYHFLEPIADEDLQYYHE